MDRWYRVFGSASLQPAPEELLAEARSQGTLVVGTFHRDQQGWFQAELRLEGQESAVQVHCYAADEPDVRRELNTWAAWVESVTDDPLAGQLMARLIAARQVYTLHPDGMGNSTVLIEKLCTAVTRFLARQTEGIYQVDDEGLFDATGTLLVQEEVR
jgi:hypothetical protein